jgi:hypothetical protein
MKVQGRTHAFMPAIDVMINGRVKSVHLHSNQLCQRYRMSRGTMRFLRQRYPLKTFVHKK